MHYVLTTNFERSHVSDDVSEWRPQERIDRLRSGSDKARFDYCVSVSAKFQTCELCKNIPEESESIRNCNVQIPYGWTDYIDRVGASLDCISIADAGLLAEGTSEKPGRHACFFTAEDPLQEPSEVPSNHSDQPRMVPCRTTWKRHQDEVYWRDLKIAQKQRIGILANNFQCHHTKRLGASGLFGFKWLHVIPMCDTRKPESQASRKILRRANWQREPMRQRNLDAPGSSKSQQSEGKPGGIGGKTGIHQNHLFKGFPSCEIAMSTQATECKQCTVRHAHLSATFFSHFGSSSIF